MSDPALEKLKEEVVQIRKELNKSNSPVKDRRSYELANKHYSHPKEALLSQLKVILYLYNDNLAQPNPYRPCQEVQTECFS